MTSAREYKPAATDDARALASQDRGREPISDSQRPFSARIRTGTLIAFCQRVGSAIRAGIDARRLWETEARFGSGTHKQYVDIVRQHVVRGDTVAEGMLACRGYFPPLVCEMVDVGERTGQLDKVFLKLAEHYQHQRSLTRNFLIGIAWPSLQLLMGIIVIGILIAVLGALGSTTDVLGLGLVGTSGMLTFWALCAAVIGAILLAVLAVIRGWFGPLPMRIAMRIPMLGNALTSLALARLTWSLAMAFDAGIDARRSVEMAIRASQNPYYQSSAPVVSAAVVRNRQFHEAFAEAGVYPQDFLQMLETAEIAGTTSESMQVLCREYEERAQTALRWLTWLTGIAIWVGIGALLIFMIFRLAWVLYFTHLYEAIEMNRHPGRI